jgi:hypothetical protein
MAIVDARRKSMRVGQVFHLTDDMEADIKTIQSYFDGTTGINPNKKYITLKS